MFFEKIKQHAGKLAFFGLNLLVVAVGVLFLRNRDLEKLLVQEKQNSIDQTVLLEQQTITAQEMAKFQEQVVADGQQKMDSIANNPAQVTKQQARTVTTTVPGTTTTITTPKSGASSKTTTKKS